MLLKRETTCFRAIAFASGAATRRGIAMATQEASGSGSTAPVANERIRPTASAAR